METTILLSKIVGPVLLLRGISILLDRDHFRKLIENLEQESKTISFSMFPIALLMTGLAVVNLHSDRSSLAAWLILIIAWGMTLKSSLLILFPSLIVKKARMLGQMGFINVVLVVCLLTGAYFTWFGYFQTASSN